MFLYSLCTSDKGREKSNGFDDCALCRARTKRHAVKIFRRMYGGFPEEVVQRVKFNQFGISVLSNY